MRQQIVIFGLLLSCAVLPAFADQPVARMSMQETMEQGAHPGTGKVIAVDRAGLKIRLAHKAIKSLGWPAMTMNFGVAEASLLDGTKAGDAVAFELGKNAKTGKWQVIRISQQETHLSVSR